MLREQEWVGLPGPEGPEEPEGELLRLEGPPRGPQWAPGAGAGQPLPEPMAGLQGPELPPGVGAGEQEPQSEEPEEQQEGEEPG